MSEPRRAPWIPVLAPVICVLVAALAIAQLRPRLVSEFERVKAGEDVYALPSPEQTVAMSFGYRSALADYLFAHVLVQYGLHIQHRRRFEFAANYFDVVNALDPTFRTPYLLADTVLTLQAKPARRRDYLAARRIVERGTRALPYDGDVWMTAGQFLAYLAPGHLGGSAEDKAWRQAGARVLARACELVGGDEALPYQCITAASILNERGRREAVIRLLRRYIAVNEENPEARQFAMKLLGKYGDQKRKERAERRFDRFKERWQSDLDFVDLDTEIVLGPPFDPYACAGSGHQHDAACATSWKRWFAISGL